LLRRKSLLSMELNTIIDVFTVVSLTQFFIHFKTVVQQLLFSIGCWTGSMRCITPQYPCQTTNYCLVRRLGRIITLLGNLIYVYYYAHYYLHHHKVNERNLAWIEFTTKVNYRLRIENQVSGILSWCLFAFSVLLMLLKGIRLIQGYVVLKKRVIYG